MVIKSKINNFMLTCTGIFTVFRGEIGKLHLLKNEFRRETRRNFTEEIGFSQQNLSVFRGQNEPITVNVWFFLGR